MKSFCVFYDSSLGNSLIYQQMVPITEQTIVEQTKTLFYDANHFDLIVAVAEIQV